MKRTGVHPRFTQDELVALRTLVDTVGSGAVIASLESSNDEQTKADLALTLKLFGSISKKISDSLAYLGDYHRE